MKINDTNISLDTSGALLASEYLFDEEQPATKLYPQISENGIKIHLDDSNIDYDNTYFNIGINAVRVGILTYNSYEPKDGIIKEVPLYFSSSTEEHKELLDWEAPIKLDLTRERIYGYTLDLENSGILKFMTPGDNLEIEPSIFNHNYKGTIYRGESIKIARDIDSDKYKQLKAEKEDAIKQKLDIINDPDSTIEERFRAYALMQLYEDQLKHIMELSYTVHIPIDKLKEDIDSVKMVAYIQGCGLKINDKEIPTDFKIEGVGSYPDPGLRIGVYPINIPKDTAEIKIEEIPQFDDDGNPISASIEFFGVLEGEAIITDDSSWDYNVNEYGLNGTVEVNGKEYDLKKDFIDYSYTNGIVFHKEFLSSGANTSDFYSIKINQPTMSFTTVNPISEKASYPSKNFIDGIYSSYTLVVPTYDTNTEYSKGHVVFYKNSFWVNTTGWNLTNPIPLIQEQEPAYSDWSALNGFDDWKTYMDMLTRSLPVSAGMYSETQHLLLTNSELNIQSEIEKASVLIYKDNYKDLSLDTSLNITKLAFLSREQFLEEGFTESSRYINDIKTYLLTKDKVK